MFTCTVTTSYTSPLKIGDEYAKHEAEAVRKLGAPLHMSKSKNTVTPELDAGIPTGAQLYELTTFWAYGERENDK